MKQLFLCKHECYSQLLGLVATSTASADYKWFGFDIIVSLPLDDIRVP